MKKTIYNAIIGFFIVACCYVVASQILKVYM